MFLNAQVLGRKLWNTTTTVYRNSSANFHGHQCSMWGQDYWVRIKWIKLRCSKHQHVLRLHLSVTILSIFYFFPAGLRESIKTSVTGWNYPVTVRPEQHQRYWKWHKEWTSIINVPFQPLVIHRYIQLCSGDTWSSQVRKHSHAHQPKYSPRQSKSYRCWT